ncbi:MAG: hypothetical protein K2N77_00870 [Lachnospiraceae bacterium]|nr:hypothetical protein [Lachnospiraceae bacterium]
MGADESCTEYRADRIYDTTGTGKTSFVVDFLARKQYCYLSVVDTDFQSAGS